MATGHHNIEIKPARERRSTPSAKEESCRMINFVEIEPVKVRQLALVPKT
jgi:hypothetical protein